MYVDIVYGFLGSGKTTFIKRLLQRWGREEKIVVLVNEFGDVGIDGTLLEGQGGDVVEMPSGCICCTLQADFRSQMLEISNRLKPERVVIEPTGVATISQIDTIIQAQLFEEYIKRVHNIFVADATGFMDLFKANPHFVESQVRNAHLVLLNKCDKVKKTKAKLIRDAVLAINPKISVLMTEFGAVDWSEYKMALSAASQFKTPLSHDNQDVLVQGKEDFPLHGQVIPHHVHREEDGLGHESLGFTFEGVYFDEEALKSFFNKLHSDSTEMGDIVRAKGIFQTKDGWIHMELASGEISFQPIKVSDMSKVSIIGKGLGQDRINRELKSCISGKG